MTACRATCGKMMSLFGVECGCGVWFPFFLLLLSLGALATGAAFTLPALAGRGDRARSLLAILLSPVLPRAIAAAT